jgi:ATP-dependent protease ClpP protease subunit
VEQDCDRDNYMSAQQGVAYGLIDRVLVTREGG